MMASAPAQAVQLVGSVSFFLRPATNFLNTIGNDELSIEITPINSSAEGSGDFTGLIGPSSTFTNPLELTKQGGAGTTADPWSYKLDEDETFTFSLNGNPLSLTFKSESIFLGTKGTRSAQLEICENCFSDSFWTYEGTDTPASSTFQLGVSGNATSGNVTSTAIPEPLTILGTGLALGFGGLFKSKSSKKQSAEV
jgi:hypothetical protein